MIYLDNNATTEIDRHVYVKQCEVLNKYFGNPSSQYPIGIKARELIETARNNVASLINANLNNGDQISFTSGATESNNAVFNSALKTDNCRKHIIISSVEHPSVSTTADYYHSLGYTVTRIGVDSDGKLNKEEIINSIKSDIALVSIMLVNSETGVINDVLRITQDIKRIDNNVLIHTDAAQAVGKLPVDVQSLGVDFLTISGHKFHAPKGVGALYIKSGVKFTPFIYGGHQEANLRAGTENTASIVALGVAARIAKEKIEAGKLTQIRTLRDTMEKQLKLNFPNSMIFGENAPRVCNTTNIGFKYVSGDRLVLKLANKGICVSSGSACNSLSSEPSVVLKAMAAPQEYIKSIRISLGDATTSDDINALVHTLKNIIYVEGV